MPVGCTDCRFWNASPSPTGASPINGSPRNCSSAEHLLHKSKPSCGAAVRGSRDNTLTRTITSVVPSHVPRGNSPPVLFLVTIFSFTTMLTPILPVRDRFPPRRLCGIFMSKPSRPPAPRPSPACAQTAPANDNAKPSVDVFRCTPSPETRRSRREREACSDIQFCIPLHA